VQQGLVLVELGVDNPAIFKSLFLPLSIYFSITCISLPDYPIESSTGSLGYRCSYGLKMSKTLKWLLLSTLIPLVLSSWFESDETSQPASEDVTISSIKDACREHSYKSHLISEDPLVIYIESFVTPEEASQLTDLRFDAPHSTNLNHLTSTQRK
jgi:hypothetical protein